MPTPRRRSALFFDDIMRLAANQGCQQFLEISGARPATLKRTWESIKEIMATGALDADDQGVIYLAVSVTNGCAYCVASHERGGTQGRHDRAMFGELMAVVGMANETNRLANGYRVPVDPVMPALCAAAP